MDLLLADCQTAENINSAVIVCKHEEIYDRAKEVEIG